MSVEEFRDSDRDYLAWSNSHSRGYVINILRSHHPAGARLHRANCRTITGTPPRGKTWTGPFVKVCATSIADLDAWARSRGGALVKQCETCWPRGPAASGPEPPAAAAPEALSAPRSEPAAGPRYEFDTLAEAGRAVRLQAGRYIPFERLSPAQAAARGELRQRLRALAAGPGEILHAAYAGFKPANMDVENLLLYNIDAGGSCFAASTRQGVRFELADPAPGQRPPHGESSCSYTYRLGPASVEPSYWRRTRRIAAFADAELGQFQAAHRLAQAWLAVRRRKADTDGGIRPDEPFAVFLSLEAPAALPALRPELVKSVVDGVVAAFQAHRDRSTVGDIAARIAAALQERPQLIADLLLDQRRAPLGVVERLVHRRGAGVQWNPSDHMCVLGQILRAETDGRAWRLSGEIWAVEPNQHTDRRA
jgi:hypothetical protein